MYDPGDDWSLGCIRLRNGSVRGSAVDAVVVASAEPGGVVLTGDVEDLGALASHSDAVRVERV